MDQVIAGASNIGTLIVAAHLLTPSDFGVFSIVFLGVALVVGCVRALVGATVLAHAEDAVERPDEVLGSALSLSAGAMLICGVVGAVLLLGNLSSQVGLALLVLAATLPLLAAQDVGRYLAIARGEPSRALDLDVLWLVVEVAIFVGLILGSVTSLAMCIAAWTASGALAGVLAVIRYGSVRPGVVGLGWLRERWGFSWRMFVAGIVDQLGLLTALGAIAAMSTVIAVAAVQAVAVLTRPAYTLVLSIGVSTTADVSREQPDVVGTYRLVRHAVVITTAVALVNLVVLLVLPDRIGELLLGDTWVLAEPLLLATGLQMVFLGLRNGLRSAVLGHRRVNPALALDITGSLVIAPMMIVGAAMGDALGVAWAGALGQAVMTVAWWSIAPTILRSVQQVPDPVSGASSPDR